MTPEKETKSKQAVEIEDVGRNPRGGFTLMSGPAMNYLAPNDSPARKKSALEPGDHSDCDEPWLSAPSSSTSIDSMVSSA
jgi:hypothetical protein